MITVAGCVKSSNETCISLPSQNIHKGNINQKKREEGIELRGAAAEVPKTGVADSFVMNVFHPLS